MITVVNSAGVVQTLLLLLPQLTVHALDPTHIRILTVSTQPLWQKVRHNLDHKQHDAGRVAVSMQVL